MDSEGRAGGRFRFHTSGASPRKLCLRIFASETKPTSLASALAFTSMNRGRFRAPLRQHMDPGLTWPLPRGFAHTKSGAYQESWRIDWTAADRSAASPIARLWSSKPGLEGASPEARPSSANPGAWRVHRSGGHARARDGRTRLGTLPSRHLVSPLAARALLAAAASYTLDGCPGGAACHGNRPDSSR